MTCDCDCFLITIFFLFSFTDGNSAGKFVIDSKSGRISVARLLDFEKDMVTNYNLTITVKDNGSPAKTATGFVRVTVNDVSDEAPSCTTQFVAKSLNENLAVPSLVCEAWEHNFNVFTLEKKNCERKI